MMWVMVDVNSTEQLHFLSFEKGEKKLFKMKKKLDNLNQIFKS